MASNRRAMLHIKLCLEPDFFFKLPTARWPARHTISGEVTGQVAVHSVISSYALDLITISYCFLSVDLHNFGIVRDQSANVAVECIISLILKDRFSKLRTLLEPSYARPPMSLLSHWSSGSSAIVTANKTLDMADNRCTRCASPTVLTQYIINVISGIWQSCYNVHLGEFVTTYSRTPSASVLIGTQQYFTGCS